MLITTYEATVNEEIISVMGGGDVGGEEIRSLVGCYCPHSEHRSSAQKLADVISIHDIHRRTDQSDLSTRNCTTC